MIHKRDNNRNKFNNLTALDDNSFINYHLQTCKAVFIHLLFLDIQSVGPEKIMNQLEIESETTPVYHFGRYVMTATVGFARLHTLRTMQVWNNISLLC